MDKEHELAELQEARRVLEIAPPYCDVTWCFAEYPDPAGGRRERRTVSVPVDPLTLAKSIDNRISMLRREIAADLRERADSIEQSA